MLLLLPPSETKRDGGAEESSLDLDALEFPSLAPQRRATLAALARLSRSVSESTRVLALGATQRHEIDRNRSVRTSPVMPTVDRYTGVLYDALEAHSLPAAARAWLGEHAAVQSALLGLTGALDLIPAYRLSASTRLPGLRLREHWSDAVAEAIAQRDGLVIDLRSEAYAQLGPAPHAHFVRVVNRGADGETRALNHWNKTAKGAFTRLLALDAPMLESLDDLLGWAHGRGLELVDDGVELRLVV